MARKKKLSYADAGVDINQANRTKTVIKRLVKSTYNKNVLVDFGSFGGLFKVPSRKGAAPVLVSSVDGVGTKLKVAFAAGRHTTVGIDIVNHCSDDILVQGARPLFFMDYIAMGIHKTGVIKDVISGLTAGCKANGCVLLGGEMAEMPDMYKPHEYDLAGMIVGVVDQKKIIDGSAIRPGDVILGLGSSGLHTNGYSLARKVLFDVKKYRVSSRPADLGCTVGDALLEPHRSYVASVHRVLDRYRVHGLAHITGGGMPDNVIRVLPKDCVAEINTAVWDIPPLFAMIEREGGIDRKEMWHVFNMGIGMTVIVPAAAAAAVMRSLKRSGETVYTIGRITRGRRRVKMIG